MKNAKIVSSAAFRQVKKADLTALWHIRTEAILSSCSADYSEEDINAWAYTTQPASFEVQLLTDGALMYSIDDKAIGFAFMDEGKNAVDGCFVDPRFQRHGIGRLLMIYLERQAFAAGRLNLSLLSSLNAIPFYQALDYKIMKMDTWHHPAGFSLACAAMTKKL